MSFTLKLLQWHKHQNKRELPWKNETNPYKIWLSEILLQQTRAEQATPYYHQFINKYPTVKHLAVAPQQEVFNMWQGLGYYSRCKNLLFTAKFLTSELKGKFPTTYDAILQLKGVGAYTAAAIASFAYGLPHAVVDGNVVRILARYFGINEPYVTALQKSTFQKLAQDLLPSKNSAAFNQAIMDFGATVCKPKNADCNHCPLQSSCYAFANNQVYNLPIKKIKPNKEVRYYYYLVVMHNNKVLVTQRDEKDIWQNLYEYLGFYSTKPLTNAAQLKKWKQKLGLNQLKLVTLINSRVQQLTHKTIHWQVYAATISQPIKLSGNYQWVNAAKLANLGFPITLGKLNQQLIASGFFKKNV
jgi:A/G-specific adenine glycosylase